MSRDLFSTKNIQVAKYAIFDLETTGLDIREDDPIEIAISVLDNGRKGKEYHTLISTEKEISDKITSINNITNAKLIGAPLLNDVANLIYKDFSDCIWVAHNGHRFDAPILLSKYPRLFSEFSFLDTKKLAMDVLPGFGEPNQEGVHNRSYSQVNLCKLFGIEYTAHRALEDVNALSKLFVKLTNLLDSYEDIQKYIIKGSTIIRGQKLNG